MHIETPNPQGQLNQSANMQNPFWHLKEIKVTQWLQKQQRA